MLGSSESHRIQGDKGLTFKQRSKTSERSDNFDHLVGAGVKPTAHYSAVVTVYEDIGNLGHPEPAKC